MNTIKVLHIASFDGNIGDAANHNGFRQEMKKYISTSIEYQNVEIRDFYKQRNLRKFDSSFADLANNYDLLVFGGGNFFELMWDYSVTGTTIDIPDEVLRKIKTPVLFNGLGVDDKEGNINKDNLVKFGRFLRYACDNDQYFLTVRNDGSMEILKKYYDTSITSKFLKIPDGGFFCKPTHYNHPEIPENKTIIAINIAGDSPDIRFSEDGNDGRLTKAGFIKEICEFMQQLFNFNNKIHIVFVPHIYKDLEIISRILSCTSDTFVRSRITVAPCLSGTVTNGGYIVDTYRKSDLSIGMRYHSNICSIAVNTPTIGIVCLPKHKMFYQEIRMDERLVLPDYPNLAKRLFRKTVFSLNNIEELKKQNLQLLDKLGKDNSTYFNNLLQFLTYHKKVRN